MKKQKISLREMALLIIGIIFSKILMFRFKIIFHLKGIHDGSLKISREGWINIFPWSDKGPERGLSTEYGIFSKLHYLGHFGNAFQVNWKEPTGNLCMWLLQLEHNKVQEIDIFETMRSGKRQKRGLYFSIYNNEESNYYYDENGRPVFRRFQVKMRGYKIMDYLERHKIDYSVFWGRKKVVWYVAGIPVAISYVFIPTQKMWLIISSEY